MRRIDDEPGTARPTPIGYVPTRETFNTEGLQVDFDGLFSVPKDFWSEEVSGRDGLHGALLLYERAFTVYLFGFSGQRGCRVSVRASGPGLTEGHTRPDR